jgi:hypothetical protein
LPIGDRLGSIEAASLTGTFTVKLIKEAKHKLVMVFGKIKKIFLALI